MNNPEDIIILAQSEQPDGDENVNVTRTYSDDK